MSSSKFIESYPWLTGELFESILRENENVSNARSIGFELNDAVGKGENYGSQMIRAVVNYSVSDENGTQQQQQQSYIIKTTFSSGLLSNLDLNSIFGKEIAFYRDILPGLLKYSHLFDETTKFVPRCYDVSVNPIYFVLEDLKLGGYRNTDRRIGLDFHAAAMVLKKVARYHALSAKLYAENSGKIFDQHKTSVVNPEETQIIEVFMCGMKDCQELSPNWPGFEHLSAKLEKFNKICISKVQTMFERDETDFNVVTHGDLHTNNVMFKFDEENKPIDVILVDFQTGYIGSPALDLAYLLYTSTANDVKEKEWDRLLQIYHTELVTTLKAIDYPKHIPTLNEIQIQMLKRSLYAAMISLTGIIPRHMEKTEHANLDLLMFDNKEAKVMRNEIYAMPMVKERILYLLDYYERKGFFQID